MPSPSWFGTRGAEEAMEPEGRNAEGGNGLFGRLVYYAAFLLIFVGVGKVYLI